MLPLSSFTEIDAFRFVECEKWRKEFDLDNLIRNFNYKEKAQVFEYYPQYYHKTDKVGVVRFSSISCLLILIFRTDGLSISSN